MSVQTVSFAWWNVHNLFPPDNHPNWRGWDEALFERKLANLGRVIRALTADDRGPDLLGVAEVADEQALAALVERHLADLGYSIVHHDSPDLRGIDVAFLYRDAVFDLHADYTRAHTVVKRSPTRDIMEVYLTVRANGAELAVLGNHWPARSAGVYESEPFRIMAAEQCGVIVDELHDRSEGAMQLLLLGDFNDEPFSRSLQEYLLALYDRGEVLDTRNQLPYLYNCMWPLLEGEAPGTFHYSRRGTPWFMFDQVIASAGLLRAEGGLQILQGRVEVPQPEGEPEVLEGAVEIFRPDWLRQGNGSPLPFAIEEGELVDGYSDHFPVVGQLVVR